MLEPHDPGPAPNSLGIVREFFDRLNATEVSYCHWKSNEHLAAALAGATDLDILVDRRTAPRLMRILGDLDFNRCAAVPQRAYPGVEDFLGFDSDTGGLAHLHLHHQLVLGERQLKGYRLPWEDVLLSTRRLDPDHRMYVADPNLEMLLLAVRTALKLRTRDLARLGPGRPGFRGAGLREFRWLAERVDAEQLFSTARSLVGEEAARSLSQFATSIPTVRELRALLRCASPGLHEYRTYAPADGLRRRWSREWGTRWGKISDRYLTVASPSKHTLPQGGLVVAFVGCDGSGKSTLVEATVEWLSWKLDVLPIYFGSGNGPASLLRQPLLLLKSLRRATRRHTKGIATSRPWQPAPAEQGRDGPGRRLRLRDALWDLVVARERRNRLAQARRARNLGMVVICDRFPQCQLLGFNDGPRLSGWQHHPSPILRTVANSEMATYRATEWSPPDLVLKLRVAPEVAAQRRPEMARESISRRIEAIESLRFPSATRIVDIDTNHPLEQVLLQVKRAIWECL